MKLIKFQVENFRNIVNSTSVDVSDSTICLVGKNESGKTAILHALHRLNPSRANVSFSVAEHYPAWKEKKDRMAKRDLDAVAPIRAVFRFEDDDLDDLEDSFGSKVVKDTEVEVKRTYANDLIMELNLDETASVRHVLKTTDVPHGYKQKFGKPKDFNSLRTQADRLSKKSGDSKAQEAAAAVKKRIATLLGDASFEVAFKKFVSTRLPRLFYFADYSNLPYSVDIEHVLQAEEGDLEDHELTARSLLRMAGADDDYLLNPNYERRKRELENVANAITADVLEYWTQNPELRVQPDVTLQTVRQGGGQTAALDQLKIRIWDNRHLLTLPFDDHSTGFQWFFSFLAAFSEYEHSDEPVVLLLDEPALGLHAKAQADFLRFINERLTPRCQVIYTTHSPFMIEPDRLDRVRLVEDRGKDEGAIVSQEIMTTDPDTVFPLQGALGYDLVQHLFIAPHNLVVEGTSDFTYLTVMSDFLKEQGREHLDEQWSVVPVGGADMIPTFVALLGGHLNVTVLVDAKKSGHQKLARLSEAGLLDEYRIITVGSVVERNDADIEDLFTEEDYLRMYNRTFKTSVETSELVGDDSVVKRIARHESIDRFDHGRPADLFLRQRAELLENLSDGTLDAFEAMFERINATLENKN